MPRQSEDLPWQRPEDSVTPNPPQAPGSPRLVDPEDDLPSAGYAGDFETTAIPSYSTADPAGNPSNSGYHLLHEPEPLPYVQPGGVHPGGRHAAPDDWDAHHEERVRAAGRRGTQDLGLLILRVALGGLLIAHGLQNLFGWWGGSGLSGLKNSLSDAGYQHADILTYVAAGGQITAGLLLVLGLFTPLAAAGVLAYLINGMLAAVSADSGRFGFFLPDGHEYQLTLIALAVAIILVGPGRYGLDAGRGWSRRPFIGSFLALLLGIGGGIAMWVLLNGANPLA
ncbi:DoxX family protein [Mycolicibacillus trivialis]